MLICDTHADTLYAMQCPDRAEPFDVTKERLTGTSDVRVQALALFVGGEGMRGADADIVNRELRELEKLKAQGFRQIMRIEYAKAGEANVFLTIEGGEAFGEHVESVDRFAELGVLAAAIIWNNENLLAHSAVSGSAEGLKPFGKQVVERMRARHMAVDLSHLNDRGAWEALDGDVPPMASHSCARALCPHPRNLSDELLRALFASGGYVGVNFYPQFLDASGECDIDRVVDHIAYMCDKGGERAIGLGSDFDGIESYPKGLRHAGELPALFDRMRARGFDEQTVEAVAGGNFKRYLERI